MADLNQTDIDVRLQNLGCKYSYLANQFVSDLKWGRKCKTKHQKDLILLNTFIEILECYEIGGAHNCLTETEVQTLLDNISKLYNICFQAIGFEYTEA